MTQNDSLRSAGVSIHDFANLDTKVHDTKHSKSLTSSSIFHRMARHDTIAQEGVTYMLSASSLLVLQSRYVFDALKSLLSRPKTTVILLVPIKLIVHSAAMNLSRLPRATGSSLRIFPFDPYSTVHDEDVLHCIRKAAKITKVDGYMSFEEDGESRLRVAAIVRLVNG